IFLLEFWKVLTNSVVEWQQIMKKELTPKELRINYIIGHGLFFEAIGLVGNFLRKNYQQDWKKYISKLSSVDWLRQNSELWEGRAIKNGRVLKNAQTIKLTAIQIKKQLDLPLTEQEQQ